MCRMQAKRQMELSYPTPSGAPSATEAAATASRASSENPLGLGFQAGHGRVGHLALDPLSLEVGTDPGIAVAAIRQHGRPVPREAGVVDVAGALEHVERSGLRRFGQAGAVEL